MSAVIENLKEAILGESNAEIKYRLFAEKAAKEGFHEISKLFNAISNAEAIHIKNHLKAIEKITDSSPDLNSFVKNDTNELKKSVKSTRENLIQAISGETFEFKKMYKSYIKTAKKNDVYLAEFSFNLARKAEIIHSKLFSEYLKKLDNNETIKDLDIYICQICGNVELGAPPKVCPNCNHEQIFFKKFLN
ncbi:MAG: rubrerythrin family protein [Candidatus Lokiarchaeota archaeon]|nr:rubrerythrin family protein [Candidatus Lokiarchaeota archaeon]